MHAEHAEAVKRRREFVKLITGRRPATRGRRPLPKQNQPDMIRMAYFAELRTRVLLPAKQLVWRQLVSQLPAIVEGAARGDTRQDAGARDVHRIVSEISGDFFSKLGTADVEALAGKYAKATSDKQRDELARQMRAAFGVEVPLNDTKLKPRIATFTATNVSLIKSIPTRFFSQVESEVLRGISEGSRWEDISSDIERRFEVSESTANLIARDQVGKFYADLNKTRQTELGITHFYWATADDERTCPECEPLDGKRYAWGSAPGGGPGQIHPQCRCGADPDVQALVSSL